MLLMSHFDKTVIKIIITIKGPPTHTWIKNLNIMGIKDNQMGNGNLRTLCKTLRKTIECLMRIKDQ